MPAVDLFFTRTAPAGGDINFAHEAQVQLQSHAISLTALRKAIGRQLLREGRYEGGVKLPTTGHPAYQTP